MKVYYGAKNTFIDVTNICLEKLTRNNIITIPMGDYSRGNYFTDPLVGTHKKVIIEIDGVRSEYDETVKVQINTLTNKIISENLHHINTKLSIIQSNLKIKHGSFNEELPEQKMAVRYLTGKERVLEIGGNIGRNTLIIASILENAQNLVTLESDPEIAKQLTENRELNKLNFQIECSALSNRKLIQKGWNTIPSDTLLPEHKWVDTISLAELRSKYNIEFDTLVLDCEGAFYYILMDMPDILNNINLIIMENDYFEIDKKNYVDDVLKMNGFVRDYAEQGGWGPCFNNFFEVWTKMV